MLDIAIMLLQYLWVVQSLTAGLGSRYYCFQFHVFAPFVVAPRVHLVMAASLQ